MLTTTAEFVSRHPRRHHLAMEQQGVQPSLRNHVLTNAQSPSRMNELAGIAVRTMASELPLQYREYTMNAVQNITVIA